MTMRIEDLDTPALTVDLDAVERNVARVQARCDEAGLALRPHIKTHKLPALAHLQLRAGAVGIACQKLGEAEVMTAAGLRDILLTYPIVGAAKARRFAALAREATMAAVGDSEVVARGLSAALDAVGASADFLVECDTGFGRTGVQTPAAAVELGALADTLPGLRFAGFMTYPTLPGTGAWLQSAAELAAARGLDVRWVSGGGTPAGRWEATREAPVLTEVRAGTYVYGDRMCIADGSVGLEDCALRLRVTVVSRPTSERAIVDAGSKALTSDTAPSLDGYGHVVEYPAARIPMLNEEHGYLDLTACSERPEIGETLTIVPNHACGTTNMHDEVVAHRGGEIVAVWPIAARGKLR
jgi:D-serine deaminase-like pyridoxal phosphate-dependent protein